MRGTISDTLNTMTPDTALEINLLSRFKQILLDWVSLSFFVFGLGCPCQQNGKQKRQKNLQFAPGFDFNVHYLNPH